MPRVSLEHEQAVRDRIVRAALEVFAERGFHRATMQDVVRASGLSVGAIYTERIVPAPARPYEPVRPRRAAS